MFMENENKSSTNLEPPLNIGAFVYKCISRDRLVLRLICRGGCKLSHLCLKIEGLLKIKYVVVNNNNRLIQVPVKISLFLIKTISTS